MDTARKVLVMVLILLGSSLGLSLPLQPVKSVHAVENPKVDNLIEVTEHEMLLTCTILAAGIFILVCLFGLFICLVEINEVQEATKPVPVIQLLQLAKLH